MSYRDEIHRRLEAAILGSGLTYRQIRTRAGLHINAVSGYMSKEKRMPSVEALGKLCKVLGVSADQILGLEDDNEKT